MAEAKKCDTCGGLILENAPAGLCPRCLLHQIGQLRPSVEEAAAGEGMTDQDADPTALLLAEYLPQFEILERLGSGGMAVVYRARQRELAREIALKIILPGMVTDALLRRFQHEAEALGRLQHPGIAQIYDYDTVDTELGPQPFFVLELIGGVETKRAPTLTAYADRHRLSIRQRLKLLAKVADAVHHAHQRGIIHRDLKPGNILVDEKGQPKILDFGVARLTDQDIKSTTMQTDMGQLIGTIAYMSPEQAGGDPTELDIRSDVYALGVIGYELLCGRLPYDVQQRMIYEAVRVIREEDPRRISSINRTLKGDIETILLKSLAKEKDRRYQSAAAFATDIQHYLHDEPVAARQPSTWYQLCKFARRNRRLTTATATVLAVLLGGITTTTQQAVRATREAERANLKANEARRHLYVGRLALAHQNWMSGRHDDVTRILNREIPQVGEEDLRGWEWYYLQSRLKLAAASFEDGQDAVFSAVWSPEGDRVATGLADGLICIWNPETGILLRRMQAHQGPVRSLSWDPRSGRLASGGDDSTVRIWDPKTEGPHVVLRGHTAGVRSVAWSPNGEMLASAGMDGILSIWDATSITNRMPERCILNPNLSAVLTVAWSPSSDRIITGHMRNMGTRNGDTTIVTWDPQTGREVGRRILTGYGQVNSIAWREESPELLIGQERGSVVMMGSDLTNFHRRQQPSGNMTLCIAWNPDGTRYVTGGDDQAVRIWSAHSDISLLTYAGHIDQVNTVTWRPDGQYFISGDSAGRLLLFQAQRPEMSRRIACRNWISSIRWAPDGRSLAVADLMSDFLILDANSGSPLVTVTGHTNRVWCAAWSPNGNQIASGSIDRSVRVWDAATGEVRAVLQGHGGAAFWIAWSPSGKYIASLGAVTGNRAGSNSEAIVWDLARGEKAMSIDGLAPHARTLAWSSMDFLAVAAGYEDIWVWDVHTGEKVGSYSTMGERIRAIEWSDDGMRLAAGGGSGRILIWNAGTEHPMLSIDGHADVIFDIDWSPDGARLATASWDRTVKLHTADTGEEVLALGEGGDRFWTVNWSPDGRRLAAGGERGEVRIWDGSAAYDIDYQPLTSMAAPAQTSHVRAETVAFDDFTDGRALKWEILHHDPIHTSCNRTEGILNIRAGSGEFFEDATDFRNVYLIRNSAEGRDFQLTACIIGFTPTVPYQQAALLCWNDADNYIKLAYQSGAPNRQELTLFPESGGLRTTASTFNLSAAPDRIWLRLIRLGNMYHFASSEDGEHYRFHGSERWYGGDPEFVGLTAMAPAPEQIVEIDVAFDSFEVAVLLPRAVEPEAGNKGKRVGPERP